MTFVINSLASHSHTIISRRNVYLQVRNSNKLNLNAIVLDKRSTSTAKRSGSGYSSS